MDDNLSQNISTCYDEININEMETNQLYKDSLETSENNKSNNCLIHNTYIAICNSLYNNVKNYEQISNLIVGLLLQLKDVIRSKNGKQFIKKN